MNHFSYEIQPVYNAYWTEEKGEIWRVKFTVYKFGDQIELKGDVDWQDGIHLYEEECIEPNDFIPLMQIAKKAIDDCIRIIGKDRYTLGGMVWPFEEEE